MKQYNFFKKGGSRPTTEQRLLTKPFYTIGANEVYARFDEWKDKDEFYFIPLYLEMTYSVAGHVTEIVPDPVWLGTFVSCNLQHPELFQIHCHDCGAKIFPFRYVGSPLSGRLDLEYHCNCGQKGIEIVSSGWGICATALRDQQHKDRFRHIKARLTHLRFQPSTIERLLSWLKGSFTSM